MGRGDKLPLIPPKDSNLEEYVVNDVLSIMTQSRDLGKRFYLLYILVIINHRINQQLNQELESDGETYMKDLIVVIDQDFQFLIRTN